jgi:hypothetical protein
VDSGGYNNDNELRLAITIIDITDEPLVVF